MSLIKKISMAGALGVASFIATSVGAQQGQSPNAQTGNAGANAGVGANAGANAQRGFNNGMRQTPWFSNPNIRQQLQLNDDQFNQLNKGYTSPLLDSIRSTILGRSQEGTRATGHRGRR